MHMQGEPRTMQDQPQYEDVVAQVKDFLHHRVQACVGVGIPRERLILDPGFGFGKRLEHNLTLFRNLPTLAAMGLPLLIGVSRKSMISQILDAEVSERLYGSIALAALSISQGAHIVRTHDVKATADAIKVASYIKNIN
jgi:dihydropteroate synthase